MCPNPQEIADLVTFTEEILNGKLHFFVQCQIEKMGLTRQKKDTKSKIQFEVYLKRIFLINAIETFKQVYQNPYCELCENISNQLNLFVEVLERFTSTGYYINYYCSNNLTKLNPKCKINAYKRKLNSRKLVT